MRRVLVALFVSALFCPIARSQFNLPPVPSSSPPPSSAPSANPSQGTPSPFPARMTIIDPKGVEVRSGPSEKFMPTNRLRNGDVVTVLRESKDNPGWYAIAPPTQSFSWIDAKYVKQVDARTGYVEGEANGMVPVLPGSSLVNKEPDAESAKIASGFQVTLLDRPMEANGRKWYPIVPPPNEARFIPKESVQPAQPASVAPPNWSRTNAPSNLPPAPSGNVTVGTPASFSQPANQWNQFDGVAPQPPQWSSWGKLRRTAFEKDGQPIYALEDRQGRPMLYVTSTPGTSLRGYLEQVVCLYGSISYRSDGYQRTYYMTASHVATR